jgi:elongation factor Ts
VGLVELNCESDFVARNEKFQELARDLAMHVVAARPLFLSKEEVPAEAVAKEKEIYRAQLAESNKPAAVIEKILDGKLEKWYSEVCLLEQPFVKDPDVIIRDLVLRTVATLGENMKIRRFVRFEVGA